MSDAPPKLGQMSHNGRRVFNRRPLLFVQAEQ